jgi:hypothetical protein
VAVETGELTASFLPGVGGRLISLVAGGREFLWRNPEYLDDRLRLLRPRESWPTVSEQMSSWANLGGSKTWPAPQGWSGAHEWPGPPDPVLDGGVWSGEVTTAESGVVVLMTSPPDERSGLRARREFRFGDDPLGFTERVTFTACTSRTVRWAIWEVAQIDTGAPVDGGVFAIGVDGPVDGAGEPRNLLPAMPPLASVSSSASSPGSVTVPVQSRVGKAGFPSATGEFTFRAADGGALTLRWPIDPAAEYPDHGSRAELWMQHPVPEPIALLGGLWPDAHLAELEVLSPTHTLAPGASASLDIHWHITPRPELT